MGRHSASYIAAQRGSSTGPTTGTAAKYVGGVGAVALSLWAGAAIAGGGLANADDATGTGTDNAGPVKSALHSIADGMRHGLADASATDGPGAKLPKSGLFKLPKPSEVGGKTPTGPLADLAGRIPHQFSTSEPAAKGNSRAAQTSLGLSHAAPIVGAVTDALRGGAPAPGATAFGVTDPITANAPATSLTSFSRAIAAPQIAPASFATVSTGFLTALGTNPFTNTGGLPTAPAASNLLGALQLLRRDTEQPSIVQASSLTSIGQLFHPTPTPASAVSPPPTDVSYVDPGSDSPSPDDTTTVDLPGVGDTTVGKYMLKSDGTVSDYGGQTYDGGKTMVEPVNVIIVDPTSKTPAEANAKLNKAMFLSGFPPQPIHTGGFGAVIGSDDDVYGQKPILPLTAYSDNLFILDNDHGRIFGPAPVAGTNGGYVWTGTFSSETLGISENGIPGHTYVSSDAARDALVLRMIASGQVSSIDYVPMENAIDPDDPDYTTGDHDGYAVVITLR